MFIKKHFSTVLFPTAAALALLSACTDKDFGYSGEDIKYAKAYQDFFGKLPEDKSWDLSSSVNHYHYDSNGYSGAATRANSVEPDGGQLQKGTQSAKSGQYYVCDNYWNVPQDTYDWLKAALKEGKDNRYLGSPFVLQLPENDFAIVPIFQGKSSITSALEVKVNGYAITTVWTRSSDIQVQDKDHQVNPDANGWMNIGFYDGFSDFSQSVIRTENTARKNGTPLPKYPSYTDEADAVRSKPIYFRAKDYIGRSDKGFMYLSLHNIAKNFDTWANCDNLWDANNEWTTIGHRLTSINPQGHMLALNVPSQYRPSPSELPNICEDGTTMPSQVIFVSCEDANGTGTDHDVNDVAFLIIGYPNAPTIVPTTEVIQKRYMCEDLGGTYDYDFNDIVVDCKQVQKYIVLAEPDELESYEENVADHITIKDMVPDGCPVQTVKIAHLCGTIPLQVRIGDFMFPKIKDPVGLSAGNDGKYWTRRDLIEQKYKNLCKGDHAKCACSIHEDYSGNGGVDVSHTNITRADSQYETTEGWNPNEEQIIPCHSWDPDNNNIIIYADWGYLKEMYNHDNVSNDWTSKKENNPFQEGTEDFADFANGKKFPVSFPKTGEYPYIIATDVDVPWMKEEQHIPAGWIDGDMSARSDANGSNHDLIGNSYYMENYPNANGEGYIWSGDVTGLAGSTGVTFAKPSAELAGIEEAYSHQYFLLHVYADVPAGEVGRIGLYSADDWKPLLASDPDGYKTNPLSDRLHPTYIGVDGLQCATIYLTKAHRDDILANGLVVASLTDGLRIKKVTTARPCLDNTSNNGAGTTDVDAGFIINIDQNQCANGRVMSSESERVASIIKPESGNELTSEEQSKNAAERSRASVPFTTRQFISGSTVTLTAIGNTISETQSYKVTGWVSTNSEIVSSGSGNPLIINYSNSTVWGGNDGNIKQVTVYPTFDVATNPQLKYADNETEKTVTLAINGAVTKPYKLYASSHNMTTLLDQFGANNDIVGTSFSIEGGQHVISLTPTMVGETSFVIYQKDGSHSGTDYGVSGELKLTVKVIESIPTSLQSLSTDDIFRWSGYDGNAHIIEHPSYNLVCNTNSATIANDSGSNPETKTYAFGDHWGQCDKYVDLSNAHKLVIGVKAGDPQIAFNATSQYGGHTMVDASSNACTVVDNGTSGKVYIIDLDKVRNGKNYLHLNFIRAKSTSESIELYSIAVDNKASDVVERWKDMKNDMASATVELSTTDVYEWNDANRYSASSTIKGQGESVFLSGKRENGTVIFGGKDSWVQYAIDLSSATVLKVTAVKANTTDIWFQFNKVDYNGNQISINSDNREYCAVIEDGTNVYYVVDLDYLKNQKGINYMYLNAINARYGHSAEITKVEVDSKESRVVNNYKEVHAINSWTNLTQSMFHKWSSIDNNSTEETGEYCVYNLDSPNSNIYGNSNVAQNEYAKLEDYRILKITTIGNPRLLFNTVEENGNKSYLEISPNVQNSDARACMYREGDSWYVMLWAIKTYIGGGKVHLNCIKGENSASITVTSLQVGKP